MRCTDRSAGTQRRCNERGPGVALRRTGGARLKRCALRSHARLAQLGGAARRRRAWRRAGRRHGPVIVPSAAASAAAPGALTRRFLCRRRRCGRRRRRRASGGAAGPAAAFKRGLRADRGVCKCVPSGRAPRRCRLLFGAAYHAAAPSPHLASDVLCTSALTRLEGRGSQGAVEPGTPLAAPLFVRGGPLRSGGALTGRSAPVQLMSLAASLEGRPDAVAMVQRMVSRVRLPSDETCQCLLRVRMSRHRRFPPALTSCGVDPLFRS